MHYIVIIEDFAGFRHEMLFFCAGGSRTARAFAYYLAAVRSARLEGHPLVIGSQRKIKRPLCRVVEIAVQEDGGAWRPI